MPDQSTKKRGLAIFLIVIGGLLLMDNLHLIFLPWFFFRWESLIILIGVFQIVVKNKWESGVILSAIGFAFLMPHIFEISFREIFRYWPALLIIVGIVILIRYVEENRETHFKRNDHEK